MRLKLLVLLGACSPQQSRLEGAPTSVVFVALGCTGEELGHGGAHRLGGAAQVLSTLLQLGQEGRKKTRKQNQT